MMTERRAGVLAALLLALAGCKLPAPTALAGAGAAASTPAPAAATGGAPAGPGASGDNGADRESLEPIPEDALNRGTPRGAVVGFLRAGRKSDWTRAAGYLDLTMLPASERAVEGPLLARHLRAVMQRKLWIDRQELSDQARGDLEDGLPKRREKVGTIDGPQGPVDLLLERQTRTGEPPLWRFATPTVARIPELYELHGYGLLGEILPDPLFNIQLLGLGLWQWLGLVLLLALALALAWLLSGVVARAVRPLVIRTRTSLDDRLVLHSTAPVRLALFALFTTLGSPLLALPLRAQNGLLEVCKALTIFAVAWCVFRFIDIASQAMKVGLIARGHSIALSIVPLMQRVLQVFVGVVTLIVLLQNLGVNVTGILAGLGIGGLAVALAAQKTVENLFGGVSLIIDQPVRVGDQCRYGTRIGTVEDIGLRSTRIRSQERTLVSVPNAEFATMQIENFAPRDRFWFRPVIALRCESTAAQIREVLTEVRKLLAEHPQVTDETRVNLAKLAESAYEIEVSAYVRTRETTEFMAIQEALLLRILEIVERAGTALAFPSQTLYMTRDRGLPGAKAEPEPEG